MLGLPLDRVLALPGGPAVVGRHFPRLLDSGALKMIGTATILEIAGYMPGSFSPESLAAFAADLAGVVEAERAGNTQGG
jgi:hypothetical protein